MTFSYGTTRFVILTENFAIKFARFRLFRLAYRGLYLSLRGKAVKRSRELFGNPWLGILKYLLQGVTANVDEYRFYREFPNLAIAPTLFTLFGLVNIQMRGEAVREAEIDECPFQEFADKPGMDLNADEYCRINGTIYLADYGNPLVQKALRQKYKAAVFA